MISVGPRLMVACLPVFFLLYVGIIHPDRAPEPPNPQRHRKFTHAARAGYNRIVV